MEKRIEADENKQDIEFDWDPEWDVKLDEAPRASIPSDLRGRPQLK